jgi:hypothetical protein
MVRRDNADDYLDGGDYLVRTPLQAWTILGVCECPPS